MQKLKVGFFGGSFNPPINTHINLAKDLLDNNILDKVIFVPVGDYYEKNNLELAIHRFNMLNLACKNCKNISVEDIASSSKKKLFATDTFKLLYDKYNKEVEMFLIMGSDNFEKMPTWKNYEDIINRYNFIILERQKYKELSKLDNVIYYKNQNIKEDITSTNIRKMIQNKEDISQYINKEVFEYIKSNKLYI